MAAECELQALLAAFFAALDLRRLAECELILEQVRAGAEQQPACGPWADYLAGVLANERDHDWAAAERWFQQVLHNDPAPALRGRALVGLGRAYDYQGRWAEAIVVFEESLAIFGVLNQPVDQVKVWKNIAHCQYIGFIQGLFGPAVLHEAVRVCRSALEVMAAQPEDDPWLTGTVWNALGLVYGCLEQWDAALDGFQRHLEMCLALDDQYGVGISYLNIGEIQHRRGAESRPQALESYRRALALVHSEPPEYDEMDVLANLGLLSQEMGAYEQALDYYRRAIDCIEALRGSITSEEARAGFLATTIDTYALMALLYVQLGRYGEAFTIVEQARSRAFLDLLEARSPALRQQISATPLSLAEVQASLPPETLLLAYFTTGMLEARDEDLVQQRYQRHRFPPAHTLLFAVTSETIRVHDTGLSPNDLFPGQLDSVVERHFLQPAIRRTLYERLIAPAADLLAGRRRLYLAPHGPLHYIPFQALLAPDGDTLLREGGPQLVYTPSATILLRPDPPAPGMAREPCLALAYNGEGANRLRFGEDEAHSIVRLVGGATLAGSQAKKAALYERAADYRLLHFSCHGSFEPEAPLASALQLAPGENLTALDVLENLSLHSELVCLSACESGLSRVRRGDELVGLVRAFLYAGARVLICTLWRVDERSTRILMERFYQEVRAGVSFAEALKRAQLYLRGLSRRQVQVTLLRYLFEERLHTTPQTPSSAQSSSLLHPVDKQTGAYLKGHDPAGDPAAPEAEADGNEPIFADPYYWAPFILIGNHPL